MRRYIIEVGDYTFDIKAGSIHHALKEAGRGLEKKLKDGGYRSRVGEFFRITIERKE